MVDTSSEEEVTKSKEDDNKKGKNSNISEDVSDVSDSGEWKEKKKLITK